MMITVAVTIIVNITITSLLTSLAISIITTIAIIITIIIFINNFHQMETIFLHDTQSKGLNHFLTLGISTRGHKKTS